MTHGNEDDTPRPFTATDDLNMTVAIENFGSLATAHEALDLVVRTARAELGEAERCRSAGEWRQLARWVHRTRGALVLFGAPALRALGERFEEEALLSRRPHAAFDRYRVSLEAWLRHADDVLATSCDASRT